MVSELMYAAVIHGPKNVSYDMVEIPSLKDDEVLVRVRNVGVCATDLEVYQGQMLYFQNGKAKFPIIPGHEWSGEVVKLGANVHDFVIGDRVVGETTIPCRKCTYCTSGRYNLCPFRKENGVLNKDGGAAQFMSYPAVSLHLFEESISFEQACLVEPSAVAYRTVQRLGITPSDTVAVFGAGTIGLLTIQICKIFGSQHIVAIDVLSDRLSKAKSLGAHDVINLSQEDLVEAGNKVTRGRLFTAVVEASGNPSAVEKTLEIVAPGGRIGLVGLCGSKRANLNVDKVVTGDIALIGTLASPGVWDTTIRLVQSGQLDTEKLVTHRLPLQDLKKAFDLMESRDESLGKIVMNVEHESI
ncbi:alcohol dehydrogenase catalytic domain-containing protein [Alicyclobacillus tolerans]|uniref:zinc-dependent alcohol dehydrogenase n=1 Tax=Alicyclobacillus tolerans TaxID=90970 RepID=UPI001F17F7DC|nr:alcohol dehydrogenase catalytic domain-containing protein [Alicyclobacillus tolerans]MCF8567345.1 alcohol dehydrogenase catalytic domain-containing protein [Alicyclobacillus tolerans]